MNTLRRISTPLLVFAVLALGIGVQIPWLGFYLDDWIILNAYSSGGAQRLLEYTFLVTRPLVSWEWLLGFELLGSAPLGWQIWALVWRALTVLAFWDILRILFPTLRQPAALAAILFAVYPIFKQQPAALTFSSHWITFSLALLSIGLMLRGAARRGGYFAWNAAALLAGAAQMYSQEFFIGLELLRPVFLWWLHRDQPMRIRWRRTLLDWLPYLLLLAGFLFWRFGFMPTPGFDRNTPVLLANLFTHPLATGVQVITMVLQDLTAGLIIVWSQTLALETIAFTPLSNLLAWGLAALAAGLVLLVEWRRTARNAEEKVTDGAPAALIFGLIWMLAGFAPGWMIGRQILDPAWAYNDRFGLAAMPGAALVVVTGVELLLRTPRIRLAALAVFIGLAVGFQARNTTLYRWSWEEQLSLAWQLHWRAPEVEQPAVLIGDGALIPYMGSWANTSLLNQLYAPHTPGNTRYWYYDVSKPGQAERLENSADFHESVVDLQFSAPTGNTLAFYYVSDSLDCLWVLDAVDALNPYLSNDLRTAAPVSNLDLIHRRDVQPLRGDVFSPPPPRTWCYHYQRASLAAQYSDWDAVLRQWEEAGRAGLRPKNGVEYRPFIAATAHRGDWDQAAELTRGMAFPYLEMRPYLCRFWRGLADDLPASAGKETFIAWLVTEFECQDDFRQ